MLTRRMPYRHLLSRVRWESSLLWGAALNQGTITPDQRVPGSLLLNMPDGGPITDFHEHRGETLTAIGVGSSRRTRVPC